MPWRAGEMPKDTSILTIPNNTSYLPVVGAYVMAAATRLGFDSAEVFDIRLAVDEACAHIIETAFEPEEEQNLTISCQRYPSGLRISIADKGLPFDPRSIKEYDAHGGSDRDLSGLPFYLIQQAVDEVRFVNRGREGKELQLIKYIKVPGIETYFTEDDLRPYDMGAKPAPPGRYEYRLMGPHDAVEIARCVYKTYGYTYPGENMYFPERVAAMNQSGEMISAVAVTEAGQVIGHCALSGRPGDPVMEMGQAVVAPDHRGRGIVKALTDMLMQEARQRGLAGLFVHAVTIHPFSQRVVCKYGFRESAILLGYAHRHVQIKEFADEELPQRETMVYAYQPLDGEPFSSIFSPDHHRSIIARIYGNLGLERELASPKASRLSPELGGRPPEIPSFDLSTRVVSALGFGQIEVSSYGPGIEQEVRNKLRDLCHEGIAAIYLNLPLGDPQTVVLCPRFEEWGFFFSGIKPRPDGKDFLCLQYLNGPRVDYDRLQIYSDFGKELVRYIRERDPLA
jgi:anti-sigma regulatory factor (Ser/Thr protein kinase)/ribosomal protein S18 acetylase RimI-like enzyme